MENHGFKDLNEGLVIVTLKYIEKLEGLRDKINLMGQYTKHWWKGSGGIENQYAQM